MTKLLARIEAQDKRIAELEAQLNQTSNNSSKPPSSDPPGAARPPKKGPTGRKPGGQPGHEKRGRELLPVERVNRVVDLVPERCGRCSGPLAGRDADPSRHQQVEIPPIAPEVTEYRCHALDCPNCGATTEAELPAKAAPVFGEQLTALICVMMVQHRLSKRMTQRFLTDVLGVSLSLGMMPKLGAEMANALARPIAEAEAYVREQDSANADESGWFQGKKDGRNRRAWIWTFATSLVVVFRIHFSRGSGVPKQMLGENFTGILGTDRWSAYNWFDLGLRQLCWSHITRDFQSFIDRDGIGADIGRLLMAERHKMFHCWHRVRDGTLSREDFSEQMEPVRRSVGELLRDAQSRAEKKTAGMAGEMLKLEEALWTFIDVEAVEPTNNFAERCIRHAVMYRKTSFGTQSDAGSRFVERTLTALTTLNLQKRNVLDFLTRAMRAHREGTAPPSLLPGIALQPACAA